MFVLTVAPLAVGFAPGLSRALAAQQLLRAVPPFAPARSRIPHFGLGAKVVDLVVQRPPPLVLTVAVFQYGGSCFHSGHP